MRRCSKCKDGLFERSVKPEHTEDLGGVVVKLINAVKLYKCSCGGQETAIPDMQGLVRAAAITRALHPARFKGSEVRFMRRALDMTQKKFAEAMDLAPETISRWENDVPGHGAAGEKLMRHNVCALLHTEVMARDYDPAAIARMHLENGEAPVFPMRQVYMKHDHENLEAWDESKEVAQG